MASHAQAHHRRRRTAALLPLLAALLLTALAACSPEDGRERGDGRGSGADTDNRDTSVEMLGAEEGDDIRDNRIFFNTPDELSPAEGTDEG